MNLFHTFTVQIAKIHRSVKRIEKEEMSEFGLKGLHVSCLYYIYTNESITFKELCEVCDEDKAGLSRSLTYLKKEGYIVNENDDGRKYKYELRLTEKGMETGARVAEKIDRILSRIRAELDPEEEMIFYKKLIKISDSLVQVCKNYEK